jgi:hypothetical protein
LLRSASTRTFSARTLFGVRRRHSSTAERVTYVPYSCCWGIPRSRAPSGISASKSMTLSPLPNRSMSDLPGQSGIALPLPPRRSCATSGHKRAGRRPMFHAKSERGKVTDSLFPCRTLVSGTHNRSQCNLVKLSHVGWSTVDRSLSLTTVRLWHQERKAAGR